MPLSRTAERIGVKMLRWGTKRPVFLMEPPSWTIRYFEPLAPGPLPDELSLVGKAGVWIILRAIRLRLTPLINATGLLRK